MKLKKVKREDFPRRYKDGEVSALKELDYDGNLVCERDDYATGLIIDNKWYELPDNPDGDYVLIETLVSNIFGFYEGKGTVREIIPVSEIPSLYKNVGKGVISQLMYISVNGDDTTVVQEEKTLIRRQNA